MPPSANRQRQSDFYPRPPRGGRRGFTPVPHQSGLFLSTPSARRATCAIAAPKDRHSISIHALREEGDLALTLQKCGRPVFLSTPSARRATTGCASNNSPGEISIHALREEGDKLALGAADVSDKFLSTPSARRATYVDGEDILAEVFLSTPSARRATRLVQQGVAVYGISIHALREEGDQSGKRGSLRKGDFYPRPPRGGRPIPTPRRGESNQFLSTPSARRATVGRASSMFRSTISIHALREEGDFFTQTKAAVL